MKKILNFAILTVLSLALAGGFSPAFADCQTLYGGGQTCTSNFSFTINKLVQVPGKAGGDFRDSLSKNDAKYSPSQNVSYELIVKNTGNQTIPTITVTDRIPDFITFVSGPGSYDFNSRTLTFTVNNLGAGQNTTPFTIVGKIANSNMLPADQPTVCIVNIAQGTDSNGGASPSNNSQFCVEKSVLGVTPQVFAAPKIVSTPATGPEMIPLLALLPGGLGGLLLRKKSNKMNPINKGGEK